MRAKDRCTDFSWSKDTVVSVKYESVRAPVINWSNINVEDDGTYDVERCARQEA